MVLISVVIPTRDRPELLEKALHSVLNQRGFDDFEVVVSDNSTDDRSRAVVEALDDPRICYVETGGELDVYQSWNFALRVAQGRYTLLLADDDGFLPDGLACIAQALERWSYPQFLGLAAGWYSAPNRMQPPRNALRFDMDWQKEGTRDPRQMIKEFFCFGRPSFSPTYIMVAREITEELYRRGVQPYLPAYPDFAFNAMALGLAKTAAVMREPVLLHGYTPESLGENAFGPRQRVEWDPPAGEPHIFRLSPLKGYYFINGWMETLLRCQEALPEELGEVQLPWLGFIQRYCEMIYQEGHWRDVTQDANGVGSYISSMPDEVRVEVLRQVGEILRKIQRVVEVRAWEHVDGQWDEWWDGQRYGFSDILGCAAQARALYEQARRGQEARSYVLGRTSPAGGMR
jgi:hypothetical protein